MPTTWDPAHKNAAIALSGSNLVATSSAGSGSVNAAVYATTAISTTVKQYFEVTYATGGVNQYFSVGVMNGAASLSGNVGATNGAAFVDRLSAGAGCLLLNGANVFSSGPQMAGGRVVRVAIDRVANRMWWAVNNIVWSGSAVWMGSGGTTDDPATGTGGLNIAAVTGAIFPAMSSAWTGEVATLNAGATAFTYAVPAGFVGADSVVGGAQARVAILA